MDPTVKARRTAQATDVVGRTAHALARTINRPDLARGLRDADAAPRDVRGLFLLEAVAAALTAVQPVLDASTVPALQADVARLTGDLDTLQTELDTLREQATQRNDADAALVAEMRGNLAHYAAIERAVADKAGAEAAAAAEAEAAAQAGGTSDASTAPDAAAATESAASAEAAPAATEPEPEAAATTTARTTRKRGA
jgi:hypothetical protein